MKDLLVTSKMWLYIAWLILFIVHVIINHIIYFSINKEEFDDYESRAKANIEPILLAIFTFKWPKDYQNDESAITKNLMRISNILSFLLLTHTAIIVLIWIFSYGK